jgi:hypothetical protein
LPLNKAIVWISLRTDVGVDGSAGVTLILWKPHVSTPTHRPFFNKIVLNVYFVIKINQNEGKKIFL